MAAREANLRDQEEDAPTQRSPAREKISLVVDRPSAGEGALLILPFAAPRGEEVFGRQLALVLQWRLRALPRLVVGHGQLLASVGSRRRYVPLHRTLSIDQARTCGIGWGAAYVLSGSIALHPTLRWSLIVREPGSGKVLFEDTLIGEPEDLLDAPGDVALAVAGALGLAMGDACQEQLGLRETNNLEAMLTYLRALDRRPAHGVEQGNVESFCEGLLRALALDPTFRPPLDLLTACALSDDEGATLEDLLAVLAHRGAEELAAGAALARELEEQGHNAQAEAVAMAVLKHEAAPISALAVVMRLAYQARDLPRARILVNAVLDLDPEHAGAHEVLGNLLAGAERFPGAAIHWEVALEQNPNHAKVLMRLGSYLVATGEYQ
ncbi:MAG: hypothetical protein ACRDGS_05405, partial [Chloroflexota bacterium]